MEACNYLAIEPVESRVAQNEDDFYTFRIPLGLLQKYDSDLLQTVLDTANVAFSHNAPGNKLVTITCPEGGSADLHWLILELKKAGLQVEVREQADTKFVDFTTIKNCDLGCVDRRLDDTGYDPIAKTAQITHAGGALVLHPKLKDEMPAHHVKALTRSIEFAAEAGAPVNKLDYHFGAQGDGPLDAKAGGGCGMYKVLTEGSPTIREALQKPDDIIEMLRMIRNAFGKVLATDCHLTGSVVYGNNDSMVYDLDNPADVEAIIAEKGLAL